MVFLKYLGFWPINNFWNAWVWRLRFSEESQKIMKQVNIMSIYNIGCGLFEGGATVPCSFCIFGIQYSRQAQWGDWFCLVYSLPSLQNQHSPYQNLQGRKWYYWQHGKRHTGQELSKIIKKKWSKVCKRKWNIVKMLSMECKSKKCKKFNNWRPRIKWRK